MHLQSLKNVYIDINKRFVHFEDKKEEEGREEWKEKSDRKIEEVEARRGGRFEDGEGKLLVSSELKRVGEERQSSTGGLSRWKTFEFASADPDTDFSR